MKAKQQCTSIAFCPVGELSLKINLTTFLTRLTQKISSVASRNQWICHKHSTGKNEWLSWDSHQLRNRNTFESFRDILYTIFFLRENWHTNISCILSLICYTCGLLWNVLCEYSIMSTNCEDISALPNGYYVKITFTLQHMHIG